MSKNFLLLICLIGSITCGVWQDVEPKQFVHPFNHGDIVGWQSIPPHPNLVTTCNGQNIVGGFGLFSQGQIFQKQYLGLPYFEQIQINVTLYQIDSWDQTHQHGFDEFQIKLNGNLVKSVIKLSGPSGGTPQCGSNTWKDEIVQVTYQGNLTGTSFLLTFTDTLNQHSKDESWGIQNLEIKIYVTCPEPKIKFGNLCLSEQELQYCHKLLGLLDDSGKNNSSIDSSCDPLVIEGKQSYRVKIQYKQPFKLDPKCLSQTVHVEKVLLKEGPGLYNEWQFDQLSQTLKFKLKHEDLVPKYGCQFLVTNSEFIWICDIHVRIYLGGELQLHYTFQLKVFLSRYAKNSLVVNVTHNLVIGECCDNKLQIKTEMKFCEDIECKQFLPSPLTVQRRRRIYIIIIIITVEFKRYYLDLVSIQLGSFIPVVDKIVRIRGIIIICLRSNIASNGLVLTVITRLSVNERLRALDNEGEARILEETSSNSQVGDDYKLKNEDSGLTIKDDGKDMSGNSQNVSENDNTALIAIVCSVAVIALLSIGGTLFYCLKIRKQSQAQKYEQKEVVSNEEEGNVELATKY